MKGDFLQQSLHVSPALFAGEDAASSAVPSGAAIQGGGASVSYRSRGVLLVFGNATQVRDIPDLLPIGFKTLLMVRDGTEGMRDSNHVSVLPGRVVKVTGHLGCFRASAAGPQGPLDLGPLSPNRDGLFDLVLDLYPEPVVSREVPPPGYIATRGRSRGLEAEIESLRQWVGTVSKPRYFNFNSALCTHQRQGVTGCERCLDVCPAGALSTVAGTVTVNPYLCQGCGSCTQACPSGALSYARPAPGATLQAIAHALAERPATMLLVHAREDIAALDLPDRILPFQAPTVAALGMDSWFTALAVGASAVLLMPEPQTPATALRILGEQVDLAQRLLAAAGVDPERIRMVSDAAVPDTMGQCAPPLPLVELTSAKGKRAVVSRALRHLAAADRAPADHVVLPTGSPFGSVNLEAARCTLCKACTRICPTGALRERAGALAFAEDACVQCGVCVQGCPEQALTLAPRFAAHAGERILKPASEMFHCIECGVPFAPRSLVEGSIVHVQHHPMFEGNGARLLHMCMQCRQKSAIGLFA